MTVSQAVVFGAVLATWAGFFGASRYFRSGKSLSAARLILMAGAVACTAAELFAVWRTPQPPAAGAVLAAGLCGLANLLFWWSLLTHGRKRPAFAFRPVPPASFQQGGPYALVRHPIYTAYLLAWLGGLVGAGEPWLLLPLVVMAGLYATAARQEEAFFGRSAFAEEYRAYRRRTGMFLPKLSVSPARSATSPTREPGERNPSLARRAG
jgi:protein-S-isoprenylcysteine O-methyltransferase Ste14